MVSPVGAQSLLVYQILSLTLNLNPLSSFSRPSTQWPLWTQSTAAAVAGRCHTLLCSHIPQSFFLQCYQISTLNWLTIAGFTSARGINEWRSEQEKRKGKWLSHDAAFWATTLSALAAQKRGQVVAGFVSAFFVALVLITQHTRATTADQQDSSVGLSDCLPACLFPVLSWSNLMVTRLNMAPLTTVELAKLPARLPWDLLFTLCSDQNRTKQQQHELYVTCYAWSLGAWGLAVFLMVLWWCCSSNSSSPDPFSFCVSEFDASQAWWRTKKLALSNSAFICCCLTTTNFESVWVDKLFCIVWSMYSFKHA